MKVFVRNNGKLFGPLDIQRVFDSYDRGVYSDNAALSEDKVEWMSIPEARSLLQQKKLAKENPQPAVAPAPTPIPPQPQYAQQPYGQSPQPMYGQQPQPMGVPPYGQPQFGQPAPKAPAKKNSILLIAGGVVAVVLLLVLFVGFSDPEITTTYDTYGFKDEYAKESSDLNISDVKFNGRYVKFKYNNLHTSRYERGNVVIKLYNSDGDILYNELTTLVDKGGLPVTNKQYSIRVNTNDETVSKIWLKHICVYTILADD